MALTKSDDDPSVEEIAEALAQITPGPWVWMFTGDKSNGWAMGTWQHEDGTWVPAGEPLGDYEMGRYEKFGDTDPLGEVTIIDQVCESFDGANYADADFIAASPTYVRTLLRRVAEVEEERDLALYAAILNLPDDDDPGTEYGPGGSVDPAPDANDERN